MLINPNPNVIFGFRSCYQGDPYDIEGIRRKVQEKAVMLSRGRRR